MIIPKTSEERIELAQKMTNEIKAKYSNIYKIDIHGVNIFGGIHNKVIIICNWCMVKRQDFIKSIEKDYNLLFGYYESFPIANEDTLIFFSRTSNC